MAVATIVISALLAVAFSGSGGLKVAGAKQSLQVRDQLRIGAGLWTLIGGHLRWPAPSGCWSVWPCQRSVSQRQRDSAC
jgi:hypothetical protein